MCKTTYGLQVHHKNGKSHDNRPKNLEWRCEAHHLEVHGKTLRTPRFYPVSQKGDKVRLRVVYDDKYWKPTKQRRGCFGCRPSVLLVVVVLLLFTTLAA